MTKERFEKLVEGVLDEVCKVPSTVFHCDGQLSFEDYGHYRSIRYSMQSGDAYMALPTLITLEYKGIKVTGCFDANPDKIWIVFGSTDNDVKIRAERHVDGTDWTVELISEGGILEA